MHIISLFACPRRGYFWKPGFFPANQSNISSFSKGFYYTCAKTRLTENVFLLTPDLSLTLTVKHNHVFGLTK